MTFDEAYDLIQNDKNEIDEKIRIALEYFCHAETDWPSAVKTLEDFIAIIELEVDGVSSKYNVCEKLKQYESNIMKNAWKAESFESLIKVFDYNQNKTLKEIFDEIIVAI